MHMLPSRSVVVLPLLLLVLLPVMAAPAGAVDGARELNHTVAVQTGLGPGDPPGYPVTITEPGSYVLTGDLTPPAGAGGIEIVSGTGPVSIDLHGFAVRGAGGAGGVGIAGDGGFVVVWRGAVHGMGGDGVNLGPSSYVHDCRIFGNGGDELVLGPGSGYANNVIDDAGTSGQSVVGGREIGNNLCAGGTCQSSRTFMFPHMLEISGDARTQQNTSDVTIHASYVSGLAGTVSAGGSATLDLYLYDETTGDIALSATNADICNPCSFAFNEIDLRKHSISIEDLIVAAGGFRDDDADPGPDPFRGFATAVVSGVAVDGIGLGGEQTVSGNNDFKLSVFVFTPQAVGAAAP